MNETEGQQQPSLPATTHANTTTTTGGDNSGQRLHVDAANAGRIGLTNLGNTCYLNSILQCLIHTPVLMHYVSGQAYVEDLEKSIINYLTTNRQAVNGTTVNALRDQTTAWHFYVVLKLAWQSGGRIAPQSLHRSLCRSITELSARTDHERSRVLSYNHYLRMAQEDAHEMLFFILDRLHTELSIYNCIRWRDDQPGVIALKTKITDYQQRVMDANLSDADKLALTHELNTFKGEHVVDTMIYESQECWQRHIKCNGYSKISDMYDGIYITKLVCTTCHRISSTFSVGRMLSLEIPPLPTASEKRSQTVQACITNHMQPELLLGDEQYRCTLCDAKVPASREYRFWDPPTNLVIQLKRFNTATAGRGSSVFMASRNNTPVACPLELDISEWIAPERDAQYRYALRAVSLHSGTLNGGHYTAYAKVDNDWYLFDDRSVIKTSPETVCAPSAQPYILFYDLIAS